MLNLVLALATSILLILTFPRFSVVWLAPFALALVLALRANAPPGAVAAFTILAVMGLWGAQGLVAGIPLDAATWLAFGLAATAVAQRSQVAAQGKWDG